MTESVCALMFKSLTTPDTSTVAGNFRPLRVITERGSVMHAVPPMPTFVLWTGILAGEVILKALSQGMPDLIPACSGGDICAVMGLGIDPISGEPWLESSLDAVGFGAHSTGDGEDGMERYQVLDQLTLLVEKSLVVSEDGPHGTRYRLLETGRAFAKEKLQQAGETEAALRSHAEAALAVFEGSLKDEYVLSTQARLERYLPDLDNARAALDWSAGADGDAQLQIALTGAIAWIWVSAGLRPEGLRRTKLAMARIEPATAPHLEARLLGSWSGMAHPEAGPQELAANARAVELYRALGDRRALYAALCQQGRTLSRCHQPEQAELALQEAVQTSETSWPPALRAPLLIARSWLLYRQARFEEGTRAVEEMLELATALDDKRMALAALIYLEQIAAAQGRLEESVARGRDLAKRVRRDRFLRSGIENIVLGNLMGKLRPNYFVGVRTPWTLESTEVWAKTHRLAGKLMVIAGLVLLVACLKFQPAIYVWIYVPLILAIVVVPIVYSFRLYKKQQPI